MAPSARPLRVAAAVLFLFLLPSCAPTLKGLSPGEREAAARFFRESWSAPSFPVRASFSGTASAPTGSWPVIMGVEALDPARETVGIFDPLGREVLVTRNDGEFLSFHAGPMAGPLTFLDGRALPVPSFSMGRLLAGSPAFEPKDGEYSRGEGGEWVLEGKGQTLRSDGARKVLASARYRLYDREVAVEYPGREGSAPPGVISIKGVTVSFLVRRDGE